MNITFEMKQLFIFRFDLSKLTQKIHEIYCTVKNNDFTELA